ncbi:hypothetical protein [Nitratidesulfovibrio termitidis]|uniref:hypothetical protein n=1 Tax=Nitratidesulfovibrio termitidis TaxID=42252 RepID=UPI00055544D1|nr:hypothetical protein [Nitratidesulfovibrio termitidis]
MIEQGEYEALRDFVGVADGRQVPFVLIGAGARLLLIDWKDKVYDRRRTEDWDFGVQLDDWSAFDGLHAALLRSGNFAACNVMHRVKHHSGVTVDFVPFGDIEKPEGAVTWPDSAVMTVCGFPEAMRHAKRIDVGHGVRVPIVTVPGFVLLKLFSFSERCGNEKAKDLQDIHYAVSCYGTGREDRIFDELSDMLAQGALDFDRAGAYLLGRDVAGIAQAGTLSKALGILGGMCREGVTLDSLVSRGTMGEGEEIAERANVYALFAAFKNGIEECGNIVEMVG